MHWAESRFTAFGEAKLNWVTFSARKLLIFIDIGVTNFILHVTHVVLRELIKSIERIVAVALVIRATRLAVDFFHVRLVPLLDVILLNELLNFHFLGLGVELVDIPVQADYGEGQADVHRWAQDDADHKDHVQSVNSLFELVWAKCAFLRNTHDLKLEEHGDDLIDKEADNESWRHNQRPGIVIDRLSSSR